MFTEQQLEILRLFSHPERVKMMALMGQGPKTLEELIEKSGAGKGIVNSQIHLLRSVEQGVIETARVPGEGRTVHHWLDKEKVGDAVAAFVHAAELEIPPRPKKKTAKKKTAKKKTR